MKSFWNIIIKGLSYIEKGMNVKNKQKKRSPRGSDLSTQGNIKKLSI